MQDFEKLGAFYLGREYDMAARKPNDNLLLYDAKDLTTHAVCVGMTGSGKTGLCLSLLEEAAIDGIPAICIDPKGDLSNLLLSFPNLMPSDFRPWIDPQDAVRKGCTVDELAARTAGIWKNGLAESGQDGARIQRYRDAVDIAIYTPGSTAGLPLTVLRSFSAPPESTRRNPEAMRDRVAAAVAGLLALMGIESDPLRSREHILLANLLERAWRDGRDQDLGSLIRDIQQPPFQKVGFLDIESFFPAKERFEFAMTLNNLIASPGFQAWMEGDALDVQRLLYTPEGKPRLCILSIAHLTDAERMFFVTILLNEVLSWMRAQSGTSSLRAILYMDEIFGYFPPTANPPSKTPLLTLMKQARAFGLGVMVCTQNPVDIDYKGLSNAGTWFLGRLQTERDKARVLDGLEGASTAAGKSFDRGRMEQILSGLGNRLFLMNNVHDDEPVVFQSRWALSYLRGPLTRDQISDLMMAKKLEAVVGGSTSSSAVFSTSVAEAARPVLPPDVPEKFLACRDLPEASAKLLYRPTLLATGSVRFFQTSQAVDDNQNVALLLPIGESADVKWETAQLIPEWEPDFDACPDANTAFAGLPSAFTKAKLYSTAATQLKDFLYRTQKLSLWKAPSLKLVSQKGESEADFRLRISQSNKEKRDLDIEKLRAKYSPKLAAVQEQIRKAEQRVEKEKEQSQGQMLNAALSIGTSLIGAMFGRKLASATNVGRAVSSAKAAGKALAEKADVTRANETVEALTEKLKALSAEFEAEAEKLQTAATPAAIELEEIAITPKKSDIAVTQVTLLWTPWSVEQDGSAQPLFRTE